VIDELHKGVVLEKEKKKIMHKLRRKIVAVPVPGTPVLRYQYKFLLKLLKNSLMRWTFLEDLLQDRHKRLFK
jgi:hypothetical protein